MQVLLQQVSAFYLLPIGVWYASSKSQNETDKGYNLRPLTLVTLVRVLWAILRLIKILAPVYRSSIE